LVRAENQADLDAKTVPAQSKKTLKCKCSTSRECSITESIQFQLKDTGSGPLGQAEPKKMKAASAAPAAPPSQPAEVAVLHLAITAPLPWKSHGRFPSAFDLTAGLKRHLARRPERSIELSRMAERPGRGNERRARRLLTGSAPSDKVCWVVGRVGAILLTTDGGAHWTLISSPLSEDLGGIRATDALHATIWNARNTKSFETTTAA